MIPHRARYSRGRIVACVATLLTLLLFAVPSFSAPAPNGPIRLKDDARIAALKTRMVFEEMRLERRERLERVREAKEKRRGRAGDKPRREVFDEDVTARPPALVHAQSMNLRARRGGATSLQATQGLPINQLVNAKPAFQDSAMQAEASIAMLGTNGLCSWNDGEGFRTNGDVQSSSWTSDAGLTWHPIPLPHPPGAPAQFWVGDPVIAANEKLGTFCLAGLTVPTAVGSGICVARGHFSGGAFAWDGVVPVRSDPTGSLFFDKEWMAADSSSGNLYLVYTSLTAAGADTILFQRSLDGGLTWTSPVAIAWYQAGANTGVQGARVAVGPAGEVLLTWMEFGTSDVDFIRVLRSVNHGVSFGVTRTVAAEHSNFGSGAPGFNRNRGITFPAIAVDRSTGPHRGRTYVTWNETVNFYDDYIGDLGNRGEIENNGTFYKASPFTAGEVLHGRCSSSTDVDHWAFVGQQGVTYIFYLDSLSASLKYSMRVFCSDTLTRLAYSGDPIYAGQSGLIVWTAPATAIYALRIFPAAGSGGYRIYTGTDDPSPGDRAGDQRDIVLTWSDDAYAWSAPKLVNDDAPWFDNWLPEVAVTTEGFPYVMWFDWGDGVSDCGGSSHIYTTRSLDGGVTWAPNQRVTTQPTAWTSALSNAAPNQGDYNAIFGGSNLVFAWADGRLGDVDVWAGTIGAGQIGGQVGCLGDSIWARHSTHTVGVNVQNNNQVFDNNYTVQFFCNRSWPGLPMQQTVAQSAGTTGTAWFTFDVPDTTATGNLSLCYRLLSATGAALDSCCFNVYIVPNAGVEDLARGGSPLELLGVWPNPASSHLRVTFALPMAMPASLELLDLGGRRIAHVDAGALGPGTHTVDLSRETRTLRPGIYSVRLTQVGRSVARKVAVVR